MNRLLLAALLLTLASPAAAQQQNVLQGGVVTSGHAAYWVAPGIVADGGTPVSGTLTGLGITQGAGPGLCINSAPVSSGSYNQLCLSTTTTGGGTVSLTNVGGATGALNLTGTFSFTGLVVTTPTGTTDQGLLINQVGPATAFNNPVNTEFFYNRIVIIQDNVAVSPGPDYTQGLEVLLSPGAHDGGSKGALRGTVIRQVANATPASVGDHVAVTGQCLMQASYGGTNTGGGAQGTCFGAATFSYLFAGATNYLQVVGVEADALILTGGSSRSRSGFSTVALGDIPATDIYDSGLEIAGASVPGQYKFGILFSHLHGTAPVRTDGTLIGTDTGFSDTVLNGLDLSGYTITGKFLKGPGGYSVDGAGNEIANGLTLTGGTQPSIFFIPTSGATKTGQIFQQANILQFADSGVAVRASLDVATGVFKTGILTVATLPAAASWQGGRAFVTDSTVAVTAGIGAIVVGGSTNPVPVFSDGTNWRIGG